MKAIKAKDTWIVPVTFMILSLICYYLAKVSPSFLVEQVSVRFIRNGILVLALVLPIVAGMGLNFAVIVGAMTAQAAYLIVLNWNMKGGAGVLFVFLITILLSVLVGYILGRLMNVVKGKEMVTSIVIGFLSNYIYQLIFIVGFGTVIKVHNDSLVLKTGVGVKNMIDLKSFKEFFNSFGSVTIGGIKVSVFLIIMVLAIAFIMYYLMNTRFGQRVRIVGLSEEKAENTGINVNRTRIWVMIISTVMAGIGQFVYLQNIGSLNVYTEHLNVDTFSCAALLAGGASIKRASVRNALFGVLLMHTLFVLSPLAGQNSFDHVALGEYFRSFIVYGVIAFALVMNIRIENKK